MIRSIRKDFFPAVLIAGVLFVDPLILGRCILPADWMIAIATAFACLAVTAFVLSQQVTTRADKWHSTVALLLVIYLGVGLLTRWRISAPTPLLIAFAYFAFQTWLIFVSTSRAQALRWLVLAFVVASVGHLVTLFPISAIRDSISTNTAYADGDYWMAGVARRETGFFPAPGFLALFASVGVGLGLGLRSFGASKLGSLLVVACFILGITSLARTFLFALPTILLVHAFRTRNYVGFSFVPIIVIALILALAATADIVTYFGWMYLRMEALMDFSNNDRIVGESGIVDTIRCVGADPAFGTAVIHNGGLWVSDGEVFVRPHNGLLLIAAQYGLLCGATFIYLFIRAFSTSVRRANLSRMSWLPSGGSGAVSPDFGLAFLGAFIVSLADPVIETPVCIFALLGTLLCSPSHLVTHKAL